VVVVPGRAVAGVPGERGRLGGERPAGARRRLGEAVDGPVDRARYSPVAWLPGADGGPARFYYVRRLAPELLAPQERQYHRRVYLHVVGTSPETDVEVFGAART
jgi:hypothetical protein